jgi:hypothetical protein
MYEQPGGQKPCVTIVQTVDSRRLKVVVMSTVSTIDMTSGCMFISQALRA